MSIKLGKFQIAKYDRNPERLSYPSPDHVNQLYDSLENFCKVVRDAPFEWFLVGGLGIDMYYGKISREHRDIDIEIPSDQAQEMIQHMEKNDYSLFRKILSTNISRKKRMVVYKETDGSDCRHDTGYKFRLVPCSEGRIVDDPENNLPFVDVTFSKKCDEGFEICYKGNTIALAEPYTAENMAIHFRGHKVRLMNPVYHAALKEGSRKPVDLHDMGIIRSVLSEDGAAVPIV